MNLLKELLQEMNVQQQSELEAQADLAALGFNDPKAAKPMLMKRQQEKKKQLANLEQSDDPLDRQIAQLRRQLAALLQKKQAQLKQKANRATM